jgi:polyisoprenoid-binding protein YceI
MKTPISLLLILLLPLGQIMAQKLYSTNTGEINFYSKTPLEDIQAVNKKVTVVLNTDNNELAAKATIKNFKFPNALMEEHFNENYMESDKYPLSTFKGSIKEKINFQADGTYPATVPGKLLIHGVEKDYTLTGTIKIDKGVITIDCDFDVLLVDHDIKRPSIMMMKIAEKIQVKNKFVLEPAKKKS